MTVRTGPGRYGASRSLVGGRSGLGAVFGRRTPRDSRTEACGPRTLVETGKQGLPSATALRHGSSRSFSSLSTTVSIELLIGRGGSVVGGGSSAPTAHQSTSPAGPGSTTSLIREAARCGPPAPEPGGDPA